MAKVMIGEGFQIEVPDLILRWDMSESELLKALPSSCRELNPDLRLMDCECLGGLLCTLAIHSSSRGSSGLTKIEVRLRTVDDLHSAFEMLQSHLESSFGPPDTSTPGYQGLSDFTWKRGPVRIMHGMVDTSRDVEHLVQISRPNTNP
jgi:hypothetical protein